LPFAIVPCGWIIRKYVPVGVPDVQCPGVRSNSPTRAVRVLDVVVVFELELHATAVANTSSSVTAGSRRITSFLP
jgi:hypothetical protein